MTDDRNGAGRSKANWIALAICLIVIAAILRVCMKL
jgi:hypothetical protein